MFDKSTREELVKIIAEGVALGNKKAVVESLKDLNIAADKAIVRSEKTTEASASVASIEEDDFDEDLAPLPT